MTVTEKNLSLEERYGKYSLAAYKLRNWGIAQFEFGKMEQEGFTEASIALGQLALLEDPKKALPHFIKAADKGDAEACWTVAALLGHDYIVDVEGDGKVWYAYCHKAALRGSSDAMHELGKVCDHEGNYLGAFYWFLLSSYYGHPDGFNDTAVVIRKYIAGAGSPDACGHLLGVKDADKEGAKLVFDIIMCRREADEAAFDALMRHALAGCEIAALFIGHFFEEDAQDPVRSKLGYQIAAQSGSIAGMVGLAKKLVAGEGCTPDIGKAFEWYKEAAERGESLACFKIGKLNEKDNRYLAAYWFSKAYRRGFEPALDSILDIELW